MTRADLVAGTIADVTAPGAPKTVRFFIAAVYANLREFNAACTSGWDLRAEQLASCLGAIGVVFENPRFSDHGAAMRMGALWWPVSGKWSDLYGGDLTVTLVARE